MIKAYQRVYIFILVLLALLCFIFGISLPILTIKKMVLIKNTFSIWEGILALIQSKTFALGIILFLFTILFPLIKLSLMLAYVFIYPLPSDKLIKYQHTLGQLAKFSMLDVFVVALSFMIIQLGWIVKVDIHIGIYWFSAAVILTILSEWLLGKDLKDRIHKGD